MHNNSIQLVVKQLFVCFRVVFYAINRDVKFARDGGSFTIIKCDDIGVIVVVQMVLILIQDDTEHQQTKDDSQFPQSQASRHLDLVQ